MNASAAATTPSVSHTWIGEQRSTQPANRGTTTACDWTYSSRQWVRGAAVQLHMQRYTVLWYTVYSTPRVTYQHRGVIAAAHKKAFRGDEHTAHGRNMAHEGAHVHPVLSGPQLRRGTHRHEREQHTHVGDMSTRRQTRKQPINVTASHCESHTDSDSLFFQTPMHSSV